MKGIGVRFRPHQSAVKRAGLVMVILACAAPPPPADPPPFKCVVYGENRPVCDVTDGLLCVRMRADSKRWTCTAAPSPVDGQDRVFWPEPEPEAAP